MIGASRLVAALAVALLVACAGPRKEAGAPAAAPAPAVGPQGSAAPAPPRDEAAALLAAARERLAAGDAAGAQAAAEAALAVRELPEALALRGRALARQRRFDAARGDLERALAAAPKDAESWALLAAVHANRGDRTEALHAFDRLAAIVPPLEAARAAWRELRFLPPDPGQPEESQDRCTRGYTALLERQPAEALREALNGLKYAPEFEWCAVVQAEALLRTNDARTAEKTLRWAIRHYGPEHELLRADAKGLLAELLSLGGDGKAATEAVRLAREALAARGDRLPTLAALARACAATGDTACARDASARILALPHVPAPIRAQAEERAR